MRKTRGKSRAVKRLCSFTALFILLVAVALIALSRAGLIDFSALRSGTGDIVGTVSVYPAGEEFSEEENALRVYFLDVGQGDCALIRIPDEDGYFNILIDSGTADYRIGLADFIRGEGIKRLDVVVGTHQHADHMGGLASIIEEFGAGVFYMPELPYDLTPTTVYYERLLDALEKRKTDSCYIRAGTEIALPEAVLMQVLAPSGSLDFIDVNSYSAVIKLTYGENSFLFTGDSSAEEEAGFADKDISAQVIKSPHHGSAIDNKMDFLRAVDPAVAVISCGRDNSYGHPHKETLENLDILGTQVLRTDTMGSILIESDGRVLRIQTGLESIKMA